MPDSRIVKEFRLGSCQVSVIDTDAYDPAVQYSIEITGPFPSSFVGMPRSLMLRVVRALALMARQSATSASKDINQWAQTIPGAGRALPRRAKEKSTGGPATTQSPRSSAAGGTAAGTK